jgi:hypothetical protein
MVETGRGLEVLQVELSPTVSAGNVDIAALPPAFHEFFMIEEDA